jgi:chromatin segregation and condensation protein Rec8/ScpA/Scc1 (kleisin family)
MDELLIKALKNTFHMKDEDAVGLAKTVEKIFDGSKEVEDMSIDKYARALFYELLNEKLLKLRREEFKEQGKQMRKYYWSFNKPKIEKKATIKQKKKLYKIYHEIPEKAWTQRITPN